MTDKTVIDFQPMSITGTNQDGEEFTEYFAAEEVYQGYLFGLLLKDVFAEKNTEEPK